MGIGALRRHSRQDPIEQLPGLISREEHNRCITELKELHAAETSALRTQLERAGKEIAKLEKKASGKPGKTDEGDEDEPDEATPKPGKQHEQEPEAPEAPHTPPHAPQAPDAKKRRW